MTDQPRDDQFDRLLQGFLAWQAEGGLVAPPTAADVAMRIADFHTGIGGRRARVERRSSSGSLCSVCSRPARWAPRWSALASSSG